MRRLFKIAIGEKNFSIFVNNDLFFQRHLSALHNHSFSEVHIFFGGNTVFNINNTEHLFSHTNVLLIPPKIFHSTLSMGENAYFVSFQTDLITDDYVISSIDTSALENFHNNFYKLMKSNQTNINSLETASCFFPVLNSLYQDIQPSFQPLSDYSMLIHDFLSVNYNKDITVSDLAKELHLSEKQTNRVVKKYTNKTFSQELTARRMFMADYLYKNTKMSSSEIAEYIGYHSYSGYWKARKKYFNI